jgi:tetratricopeptide (TPR) repeat protein
MIRQFPVAGTGAGGFSFLYQKYQAAFLKNNPGLNFVSSSYAHNDYLQMAVETGIAGIILFLVFIFAVFAAFDSGSRALDDRAYILCCGFLCSAAGVLFESFFNFPLFVLPTAAFFWVICGFIFTLLPKDKARAFPAWPAAAALLLIFAAAAASVWPGFISGACLSSALKSRPADEGMLERSIKYGPFNITAYTALASSRVLSSDYAAALGTFEKALLVRPYSADIIYNAASVNMKLKDYAEAEKYFRQSLELYPGFAQAHLGLAKSLEEQKRGQEAAAEFALAIKYDPEITRMDFDGSVVDFREANDREISK